MKMCRFEVSLTGKLFSLWQDATAICLEDGRCRTTAKPVDLILTGNLVSVCCSTLLAERLGKSLRVTTPNLCHLKGP